MADLSWQAAADGRYWMDVAIGSRPVRVMIDLGLVDPAQRVGFELEPALYDELKRSRQLSRFEFRFRRDANGEITRSESGLVHSQLIDPQLSRVVGPLTNLYVCRGSPGIPNRVGVVFFHCLVGSIVYWDLSARTWRVQCT
jgi:hypothetical protein